MKHVLTVLLLICLALIAFVVINIIDARTGPLIQNRKAVIISKQFEPEHLQLVGKILTYVPDKWYIWVKVDGQEPGCYVTQDFYYRENIGNNLTVDYTVGGITGTYYISAIH